MQLNTNSTLQGGKYRIISVLGQGGFGITYLAEHTILGNRVAIKEFFPKEYCDRDSTTSHVTLGTRSNAELVEKLRNRFVSEARLLSSLQHPGIIRIHDIFQENDTAYYVMDYIDGEPLSEVLKREGALPRERALRYISIVSEALAHIHANQMTHLDIKPANIMLRYKDDTPVLIDFGLSKQYGMDGQANSSMLLGISQGFSPIEQYTQGAITSFSPQSDVYALGATYFNLLTGTVPPDASAVMEQGIPFPPQMSISDAQAISWAMRSSRADRCPSAKAFLQAVRSNDQTRIQQPMQGGYASENTRIQQPMQQPMQQQPYQFETGQKKSNLGMWIGIGLGALAVVAIIVTLVLTSTGNSAETAVAAADTTAVVADTTAAAAAAAPAEEKKEEKAEEPKEEVVETPPAPPGPNEHLRFSGSLGKYPVQMELNLGSSSGRYRYTKTGSGAYLALVVDSYNSLNGNIVMYEYNDNGECTGTFNGRIIGNKMTGTFINYKGTSYSINLH